MALTQVQPGMLGTPQPYAFKNRLINGNMVISQRDYYTSPVTITGNTFTLDRWNALSPTQSSKYSVQQNAGSVTPPAGFVNYLGVTSLSSYTVTALDRFGIYQAIEGYNIADLNWGSANAKTVTLSFWVYSSLTGSFGASVRNSAADRSYPFSYTISSANTWTQISVTIPGDTTGTWLTTNGVGISLIFGLGTGSTYSGTAGAWASGDYRVPTGSVSVVGTNGATWYVTGVQFEVGVTATTYDYRSITTETELCQRYYYRITTTSAYGYIGLGYAYSNSEIRIVIPLKVTMRDTPSSIETSAMASFLMVNGASESAQPTTITINTGLSNPQNVEISLNKGSAFTAGLVGALLGNNNTAAYIGISADI